MRTSHSFQPFAPRARRAVVAIVLTFALASAVGTALTIWKTGPSKGQAAVVEVASRQRTLAERYVEELLLVRAGAVASPAQTGSLLTRSVAAQLTGGEAPPVNGDDDSTRLPRQDDPSLRAQLLEEQRLVHDLTLAGRAFLAGAPVEAVSLTGHERLGPLTPTQRLRVLAALTSNVSLDIARTVANRADRNIATLTRLQVGLGIGGLVVSLLLAWALVAATRRQTAHFQSLVNSSTDLVLVLSDGGCRYASGSVTTIVGQPEANLLRDGFLQFVHDDDREVVENARRTGQPQTIVFRLRSHAGEWRHLEAHLTDLRHDRHVRGVVLNARDITERFRLEQELTRQAQRDTFGTQLVEALEMADEEETTLGVVERAMTEISSVAPTELLLSDSSRAHLERAAVSPTAGAPACPVESPFSCVAVRRGNPVVFESSEALNACPKLRDRTGGPCSAVCVPVSFMGRSLGVLHATGPEGRPPDPQQIAQLTTLATQAGARIGTVRAFEKTQLQASTDGLTGLNNRRTLETHLRALIRDRAQFALAIADLDHFKQLNDKHGHEAGDRALRSFAQTVQRGLRDGDLIARWGGEEFVIVMPGADAQGAVAVLERVREALARAHHGGHPVFTASFGVADTTHAATLEQLLQVADTGLYISKDAGRDRITIGEASALPRGLDPTGAGDEPGVRPARSRPAFHDAVSDEDHEVSIRLA